MCPTSRDNALYDFIQKIASSNLTTVKGYHEWGLSFIVRFLPANAGEVRRFDRVLFFSPPLQFIILQIIPKLGAVNFKLVKAPLNKVQTKILESLGKFIYLRTTL